MLDCCLYNWPYLWCCLRLYGNLVDALNMGNHCGRLRIYQLETNKEIMILGFISLALSIACYSVSQLAQHGKLRWGNTNFWDIDSWTNKYKIKVDKNGNSIFIHVPNNWYYRFFKLTHREKFPLSATFLVWTTDGYHLMQFMFLLFLSLAITLFIGFNWYLLLGVWSGIHIVHALVYKLLSRQ